MAEALSLAIDIGGTKMAAAIVSAEGVLDRRAQVPTPHTDDAEVIFSALAGLVANVVNGVRPQVCGVGCGGPMDPGGETVSPLNIHAWRSFPLRARLAELTGLTVFIDNDAKALALGEGWLGAARGRDNYIAMVVSTGVGGGVVLGGDLLDGRLSNAGHIGHVVVEPDGHDCPCGGRGCLEAEASGLAIEAITGTSASHADAATVERTGTLVGRAIASVANLLDLDLAVIGGSVALGFGTPFFDAAQREIRARARLDFSRETRVVPVGLGKDGPLVGASAVAWRRWSDR